jgi:hypothetical protein
MMLSPSVASFDYLVGAGEKGWRDFEAERLGGRKVDCQLEARRLQVFGKWPIW